MDNPKCDSSTTRAINVVNEIFTVRNIIIGLSVLFTVKLVKAANG